VLELITVQSVQNQFHLSKILINPAHICVVQDHHELNNLIREGKANLNLNENVKFSEVIMSAASGFSSYIVVGSSEQILERLKRNKIQLLRD